eukprot:1133922-Rhodomonas_salina.3
MRKRSVDCASGKRKLWARAHLHQHKLGLRHGALGRIDKEAHTIDDAHHTLHLAPPRAMSVLTLSSASTQTGWPSHLSSEIRMARSVDDVDLNAVPGGRSHLGHDRDASLALKIHAVHRAIASVVVVNVFRGPVLPHV